MRKTLLFSTVLFLFSIAVFAVPVEEFLIFNDFDKGFQLANEMHKNVIVLFSSPSCVYCKKLKEEVLPSDEVSTFIINHYILIELQANSDKTGKFDVDKAAYDPNGTEFTYEQLFQLFGVRGVPATAFFNENQEYLGKLPGFYKEADYLKWLKFIQQKAYENGDISSFDPTGCCLNDEVTITEINTKTLSDMQKTFPELLSYWSFEKFKTLNFISLDLNKMYIVNDTDKKRVTVFVNGLDRKNIQNIYVVNQ